MTIEVHSISMDLALYAYRCEHERDPVDGNEVLDWVAYVGFGYIGALYGRGWETERDKPRPITPLRFTGPIKH